MYYLFLLLSVVLLSLQFAVNKFYQKENGKEISVSLLYTCLAGFSASLFFLIINRFNVSVTGFSLLCAAGVSVLCLLYTLLGFYIFSIGSFSLYMMFLMLGGMILPFIYGIVFLNDYVELSVASLVARFTGVLLMTLALIIPTTGNSKTFHKKKGKLSILLYICVFLMNGFVSVISKLHQIEKVQAVVDNNSFVFWMNLFTGTASGIVLLAVCLKKRALPVLSDGFGKSKLFVSVILYAVFSGTAYLLQLIVAGTDIPASVQYPFITGGSVVLSAVCGKILFGEKLTRRAFIGVLIAFFATFLFLV